MIFEKDDRLFLQNDESNAVEITDDDIAVLQRQADIDRIEYAMEDFVGTLSEGKAKALAAAITEDEAIYDKAIAIAETMLTEKLDKEMLSIVRSAMYEAAFTGSDIE